MTLPDKYIVKVEDLTVNYGHGPVLSGISTGVD
jgi:ABC-type Mn2+/Zn2+ transport system ATPase subunit